MTNIRVKLPSLLALIIVVSCVIVSGRRATAEIYKNIGYFDTFSELKEKFPNAKFTQLRPGWAQEGDVLYSITGSGMSGIIIVKLNDSRPFWRKKLAENTDDTRTEVTTFSSSLRNAVSPLTVHVRNGSRSSSENPLFSGCPYFAMKRASGIGLSGTHRTHSTMIESSDASARLSRLQS